MRINEININKFQGLHHAALVVTEPVLLVSGGNGAGKSSLLDAIAMAVNGEARRVDLKKNWGELVTEGSKKGSVALSTDAGVLQIDLPAGKGTHAQPSPFLPLVLDASRFSKLDMKERRKLLFDLTGASAKPQAVADMLIARGLQSYVVEQVKPLLLSGFPAAHSRAKELASESRGAWKATTGETYGRNKAEGWKPVLPAQVVTDQELEAAAADEADKRKALDAAHSAAGEADALHNQSMRVAARAAELKQLVDLTERRRNKLNKDSDSLREWQDKHAQAVQAGTGIKVGLIHDLARFIYERVENGIDPAEAKPLLDQYTAEHGEIGGAGDPELASRAAEFAGYVAQFEKAVTASRRDLEQSEQAKIELESLQATTPAELPSIDDAQAAVAEASKLYEQARAKHLAMQQAMQDQKDAAAKEEAAAEHHALVQAWTEVAEALAPSGIPAEILQGALGPVNDLLRQLSETAGWKEARITGDIDLTYGDRVYGLLSESEQWRVDTLLATAIAKLSGIGFVMIDRFDVLEPAARPQALKLLLSCTQDGTLEQAIMAGTMKAPMSSTPAGMQQVWVESGAVAIQESAA